MELRTNKAISGGRWSAFASADIVGRAAATDVVGKIETVPMDSDLLLTPPALGVTFGD